MRIPAQAVCEDYLSVPRILVLDDEPLISMLVEDWLTELGCEVVGPARSVEEGLDIAGSAELDAAILDVNLGGKNSFLVADALKQRGIPFAFATGDSGCRCKRRLQRSDPARQAVRFRGREGRARQAAATSELALA